MTQKEFWKRARQRRKWSVLSNATGNSVVRCRNGYCPLGAVEKLGSKLPGRVSAAERLGLSVEFTSRVADAADYADNPYREWLLKNLGVGGTAPGERTQ